MAGEAGNPYVDVNVYAFDGETYAGYSGISDGGGQVIFTLPQGDYHFRADYDGVQFWSNNENSCTIPGCEEDAVTLPGGTGQQQVSIDYTYDALNRLISAEYSNGTDFAYTYDAAGNVLTYAETHFGYTTTTTYTYDAANQLLTAIEGESAWYYSYDGNGSQIMSSPAETAANGATRYTYNTAGYLTKVENFTTEWQIQSEMTYDGLGNRLEMTTYSDGEGNTTRYQLDNGQTLSAIGAESSTFYLYGLGAIGTLNESWSYILSDGAGSMRQLVDEEGAVTLSVSYTPWGDTMEVYGSGMLNLGYLGGVYDAGTGLIYMGNGQYYDPSTGRFLTRGTQQDQSNPYTPWNSDPAGMLIAPLVLLALVFGRKKTRTKFDQFIILFVIVLSVGLSVSAVNGIPVVMAFPIEDPDNPFAPTTPANQNNSPGGQTSQAKYGGSGVVVVISPTPNCTVTPTPTGTATPTATGTATSSPTPTATPTPKYSSAYWKGMTSLQLGAYQQDQGSRNDCAIYAISAALNLLENPTTPFDGKTIALDIDNLWLQGNMHMRFSPNSATFPSQQKRLVKYMNSKYSLSYHTSPIYSSSEVYPEKDKERMRNVITDNDKLQLVTIYFRGINAPELWETGATNIIKPDVVKSYDANGNPVDYIFGSGHTMLLVAYDPKNVNSNNNQVYEWGFVNSWKNGGKIYWMRDQDFQSFDVVEIRK